MPQPFKSAAATLISARVVKGVYDMNMSVLDDKFNMYYSAARKAYSAGNGAQAKRNYMLAAETLLELAKLSTPRLKEARVQRAKRFWR